MMTDGRVLNNRINFELPGVRFLFAGCSFLGFVVNYCIRVNLSVAIVAMINNTAVYHSSSESTSHECSTPTYPFNSTIADQGLLKDGEFSWHPQIQGIVLGSFYYGYCLLQLPGGRWADIYSGKWVFGLGNLISALLTLLTPIAARTHVIALIVIRALEGLAQGVCVPSMHALMSRWFPDCERGFCIGFIYAGIGAGTVIGMAISGILCDSEFLGGWPSSFYVIGIGGCIWFLLWSYIVTDSPMDHPYITKKELNFITSNQKMKSGIKLVPWRNIMTSVPFWAVVVVQVGCDWCFYTLLSDMPTFFATVLNFDIRKNGYISSLSHVLKAVVSVFGGYICDVFIRKRKVTTNFVRKFSNTLGCVIPVIGILGVCLAGCDAILCVIFLIISVGSIGFTVSGYLSSLIDISPEYAGTLMGLANTLSALSGFFAPLMVGIIIDQDQSLYRWHIAFGITGAILMVSNVIYVLYSSAEKQTWSEGNCIDG